MGTVGMCRQFVKLFAREFNSRRSPQLALLLRQRYNSVMKVSELFYQLDELMRAGYADVKVVLAADEEGNDYRHLADIGDVLVMTGQYHVEPRWGEDEQRLAEVEDDDDFLAIVLWP